jgi:hypothetical protein
MCDPADLKRPGLQLRHDVDPFSVANVPGPHREQEVAAFAALANPCGHGMHTSLALALNVPGMHSEHETDPFPCVNSPSVHLAHAIDPAAALTYPPGHTRHETPPSSLNFPGMHREQVTLPLALVNSPASHEVQFRLFDSLAFVLMGQGKQVTDPLFAAILPGWHGKQ